MKKIYLIVIMLFNLAINAQTFQWALQQHYSAQNRSESVGTDKWGNVYITGRFIPSYNGWGGTTYGCIFSKYTSSGNLVWTDTVLNVRVIRSVVDSMGNTYATGYFSFSSATFGNTILYGSSYSGFTVKYNSAGQCLWAKSIFGFGIALHPAGGCYVVGQYNNLIRRLDNNGNIIWTTSVNVKNPGGLGLCNGYSIAADKYGNVYLTGQFKDTVAMSAQDTIIYNGPFNNNYTARYDSSGNFQWVKTDAIPSYGFETQFPFYIAVDSSSNPIVTGCFTGTLSIGANTYAGSYYYTYVILAQYNSYGNIIWSKAITGTGSNLSYNVIIDHNQNFYITGIFDGTTNFGNGVTGTSQGGAYILKFDKYANAQWIIHSTQIGGGGGATGYGICSDNNNNLYMAGSLSGSTAVFGNTQLSTPQYGDIFLTQIKDNQITSDLSIFNREGPSENDLLIYPNPNAGTLMVRSHGNLSDKTEIKITNIIGQCIYGKTCKSKGSELNEQIDLSHFPKGVYFIQISTGNATEVRKIVLE